MQTDHSAVPPVCCIDVGGTSIKSGVLVGAELVGVRHGPTPHPGDGVERRLVDHLAELVDEIVAEHGRVGAVGLVVPGLVDTAGGVGIWSANLGWRDVPLRDSLSERLGIPVAFGHDVRAGGLAEARLGAGVGHRDLVFLPVGTGIAAAVVVDGVLVDNPRGPGELGHLDVGHGERCACGGTGCLEAVSSAAAVSRRYAARTGTPLTAAEVVQRGLAGDPAAAEVWADAVDGLARALAVLATLLAPELVVMGGGLTRAGDALFIPLRAELDARLTFQPRPEIVPSSTGELSGCLGAGLLAQDLMAGALR